jgi:hypothetical protein
MQAHALLTCEIGLSCIGSTRPGFSSIVGVSSVSCMFRLRIKPVRGHLHGTGPRQNGRRDSEWFASCASGSELVLRKLPDYRAVICWAAVQHTLRHGMGGVLFLMLPAIDLTGRFSAPCGATFLPEPWIPALPAVPAAAGPWVIPSDTGVMCETAKRRGELKLGGGTVPAMAGPAGSAHVPGASRCLTIIAGDGAFSEGYCLPTPIINPLQAERGATGRFHPVSAAAWCRHLCAKGCRCPASFDLQGRTDSSPLYRCGQRPWCRAGRSGGHRTASPRAAISHVALAARLKPPMPIGGPRATTA